MKEDKKFKLSQLVTNKQYRSIIVLIFYFFFFLFLGIAARNALSKKQIMNNENIKEKSDSINSFSSIKSANYKYKYTLSVDDKIYIYEGKKYNNKDSYTLTTNEDIKEYVQVDDFSFEIKDKEKVLTDKPIYYLDFFDIDILEQIIKQSTKKDVNIYSIDNRKLDSILKRQLGVNNKLDNSIMLTLEEGIITRIDINYTNYIMFTNKTINKVLLTLEYKDFGTVLDFDVKNSNS